MLLGLGFYSSQMKSQCDDGKVATNLKIDKTLFSKHRANPIISKTKSKYYTNIYVN